MENRWRTAGVAARIAWSAGIEMPDFCRFALLTAHQSAHPGLFQLVDASNCMRQFWRMPRLK
jgi:hypothetical protein